MRGDGRGEIGITTAYRHGVRVRGADGRTLKTAPLEVRVQDNGPGMGEPRQGSMGLRLVRSLASQLSGRVEVDSSASGTCVTMIFPLVE